MRLIDADALEVDWYDDYETEDGDEYSYAYVSKYQIDNAPTIDATPVIRCSYCKFFKEEEGGGECRLTYMWLSDNDYCSLAERIGNHETD